MNKLLRAFTRTKHLKPSDFETTPLNRCLSTLDLTALAISSTIGTGIYVLTGEVTRLKAGPSVILSFLMASFAAMFCGLCYAEFGARFPKAGSAYLYSYVTVGELCAFTIGWNLALEYIVGTASTARVWSSFLDALLNKRIHKFIVEIFGTMHAPLLSDYPDVLAALVVIAVVTVVAIGVKQSVTFNWFFLALNVVVILFIIITGLWLADFKNWSDFFPFGFSGMMAGASILFYSFVGFDVVGSCGEEAKNPSSSIPKAIIGCLVFSLFAYLGVAIAQTLLLPYYELKEYTSIASAYEQRGFPIGKYIVAMGATFALLANLTAQMFPLPRIFYAMATDGVIFSILGKINKQTETPVWACVVTGILTALLALLLDLISLVEMLSIGTLLAYTIVALCVLLLRYRPGDEGIQINRFESSSEEQESKNDIEMCKILNTKIDKELLEKENGKPEKDGGKKNRFTLFYERLIGWQMTEPTEETYTVVKIAAAVFIVLSITVEACLIYGLNSFTAMHPVLSVFVIFLFLSMLFVVQVISCQPQSKNEIPFKVPLVPLVPLLSVFVNIYLIMMLSFYTWIRFAVWMTLGMSIYLFYGIKNSKENPDSPHRNTNETEYTKLTDTDENYSKSLDKDQP